MKIYIKKIENELNDIDTQSVISFPMYHVQMIRSQSKKYYIREKEVFQVFKDMKTKRSPGSDDFTVEFNLF